MNFNDLQLKWKALVVLGAISLFIIIGLILVILIMNYTDWIQLELNEEELSDIDLEKYNEIINPVQSTVMVSEEKTEKEEKEKKGEKEEEIKEP